VQLLEGFVREGFVADWLVHREWTQATLGIIMSCIRRGTDTREDLAHGALIAVLRKVVSVNPILNIYAIQRATKDQWEEAFVLMLAMLNEEELANMAGAADTSALIEAYEHVNNLRLDQSVGWVVEANLAALVYEAVVAHIVGIATAERWETARTRRESCALSRAMCMELAGTALFSSMSLV